MGVVRIVGGQYKRTPLPVNDREGLRPTSERVRETVFDWLTHLMGGLHGLAVCDMFAGSGAMGLESASRGADRVLCIEKDRKSAFQIKTLVEKLRATDRVDVVCGDAFVVMERTNETFDVIFIDPPFAERWQVKAAALAIERLKPRGLIYLEAEKEMSEEELNSLSLESVRRGKAGTVYYLLAQKK